MTAVLQIINTGGKVFLSIQPEVGDGQELVIPINKTIQDELESMDWEQE